MAASKRPPSLETSKASRAVFPVLLVLTTVVGTSLATAFRVPPVAAISFIAVIATLRVAALIPNGVRQHVQSLDWSDRIVARNDQLATYRAFFGGLVSHDDAQTRTRVQRCRERIVDQLPMTVFALERDARDVQTAFTDVTDGDGTLRATARLHSAEAQRAGDSELTRRRIAVDRERLRTRWIAARDCQCSRTSGRCSWARIG